MTAAMTYHPEDVRAELKKRHGTLGAFALRRGLKLQALADWLRGRTSAPVAKIVAEELGVAEVVLSQSMTMDDSEGDAAAHRLNAGAR